MGYWPFSGGILFAIVPLMVAFMFFFVFGLLIVTLVRNGKQWKKNNASPVLTVEATVVAKRTSVSHHTHNAGTGSANYTSSSSYYYATFEVESGDRMEFGVASTEYGMLAEQDRGRLTFQGTRYLGFERARG